MQIGNTRDSYGAVSKSLHWLIAALILTLLGLGLYMKGLPDDPAKFKIYALHKSLGITVLAFALCRILWHLTAGRPELAATLKPAERFLAKAVHGLLYVLMVAMPLSGILMSNAANFPVGAFGLFILPPLIAPNQTFAHMLAEAHEFMGWTLLCTVGLHVAGALKHFVIDRDQTLQRMLPALLALLAIVSPAQAAVPHWSIVKDQSQLTFTAKQSGAAFTGSFDRFAAEIAFDPEHLDQSSARATIDITSINTQSASRDADLKGGDWFDTVQFPAAVFEARDFQKIGDDTYEAKGNLTIRKITMPVSLVFSLRFAGDSEKARTATVDGLVNLDRSQFGLGGAKWADTGVIANEVPVHLHLVARHAGSNE